MPQDHMKEAFDESFQYQAERPAVRKARVDALVRLPPVYLRGAGA
jgi:hypothetical protein